MAKAIQLGVVTSATISTITDANAVYQVNSFVGYELYFVAYNKRFTITSNTATVIIFTGNYIAPIGAIFTIYNQQHNALYYADNAKISADAAAISAADAAASSALFLPATAVTDWNNYRDTGTFFGAGLLNGPPLVTGSGVTFYVAVRRYSATRVLQQAIDLNGVTVFQRTFNSPTWSAWKPIGNIGGKARLKAAAAVSAPTATWTVVPLDTVTYNENPTDIVLAANTVAAPAWASYVDVTLFGKFAVAPVEIALRATKNGGVVTAPYSSREPATTLNQSSETTISFSVAGGNLIGFQIKQTSGALIATLAGWCEMTLEFK